jgi:hypothetical protein
VWSRPSNHAAIGSYEEIWRPGAGYSSVGLLVDLAGVSEERVQEFVEDAWRNKVPSEWWPPTTASEVKG